MECGVQKRLNAQEKFDQWRIRNSMKFNSAALLLFFVYLTFYCLYGVQGKGFDWIPFLCVGLSAMLHSACVCLQAYQVRNLRVWRCDTSGCALAITLICDAALVAVTRVDVRYMLFSSIPDLEDFLGEPPFPLGRTFSLCDVAMLKQEISLTTQALQWLLLYFILFVLSAKNSCFVAILAPVTYASIELSLGIRRLVPQLSIGEIGTHVELLFMFVSIGVVVLAKLFIEKSKLALFELMEDQKRQLVNERVLRCEAEFAKEAMVTNTAVEHSCLSNEPDLDNSSHRGSGPASIRTCPAALTPLIPTDSATCLQGSKDCLPLHAMAWTDHSKLPQLLSSLAPGQRILCYDNLVKNLTYARIVKLEKSRNTQWVKLSMEDGSMLEVTADHPMAVKPAFGAERDQKCICAGDLKAGRDRLMVLKFAWVAISDVSHSSSTKGVGANDSVLSPEPNSITISVEQKERHEIFVTTGDKNGNPGPPIAVGSSDRDTKSSGSWTTKNTFVHYHARDETALKRSKSDPLLYVASTMKAHLGSASQQNLMATTSVVNTRFGSISSLCSSAISIASTPTTEICSSMSAASRSDNHVIKVGRAPYNDPHCNVVSLSQFARLQANGLPSLGSDHPANQCKSPCSFQFAGLVKTGRYCCTAGALCEYCHDSGHQAKVNSKLRKLSRVPKHLALIKNRRNVR